MNQTPDSLILMLRVESWYSIPPLWFFKAIFGSIEHHQHLLSTIYLKRRNKIKPRSKNKNRNKPKAKTNHQGIFITKLRCTQNASLCNGLERKSACCCCVVVFFTLTDRASTIPNNYTWLPIRYVCWTEKDQRNIYQAPMRAKKNTNTQTTKRKEQE